MKRLSKIIFIIALVISISTPLTGCHPKPPTSTTSIQLFLIDPTPLGNIEAPITFNWQAHQGTTLNFICEDNISAHILTQESERFTQVTGIKVNIKTMDFNTLEEKINIDFISQTAQYDLIYVDPYQTLNRFSDSLEDLNQFETSPDLPHIVGGLESFFPNQTTICSYFQTTDKLSAIPFDSTTMILFYRKDIFEQYKTQMYESLGYTPKPGSETFTWEQYLEVSRWITEHVPNNEVKHGSISMSARHNSIYTLFSTILGSYGGDYFAGQIFNTIGIAQGGPLRSDDLSFRRALTTMKAMINLNPLPASDYTWTEVTDAFIQGESAMMINWDENISAVENPQNSQVADKVGYAVLPYGTTKSANIYGGSGIGINTYASQEKKLASWLFIVWATSPEVQMKTFLGNSGGNLPVRPRLVEKIRQEYIADFPQVKATLQAQQDEYAYYRPKMKKGYEFETIMIDNLYEMTTADLETESTAIKMRSQWNEERRRQ